MTTLSAGNFPAFHGQRRKIYFRTSSADRFACEPVNSTTTCSRLPVMLTMRIGHLRIKSSFYQLTAVNQTPVSTSCVARKRVRKLAKSLVLRWHIVRTQLDCRQVGSTRAHTSQALTRAHRHACTGTRGIRTRTHRRMDDCLRIRTMIRMKSFSRSFGAVARWQFGH